MGKIEFCLKPSLGLAGILGGIGMLALSVCVALPLHLIFKIPFLISLIFYFYHTIQCHALRKHPHSISCLWRDPFNRLGYENRLGQSLSFGKEQMIAYKNPWFILLQVKGVNNRKNIFIPVDALNEKAFRVLSALLDT